MLHANPWVTENPIVTWRGSGNQTTEDRPAFQIGRHNTSVQLPIQVMSMKKRTVKLAIYPVKLPSSPRNVPMPDITALTALKAWLDATFGDQINALFEVTYKPQTDFMG